MPSTAENPADIPSGILDNHRRGRVGDFLRDKICAGSELSFVSAYFTIHAYEALREELNSAGHLRFLFGEPSFVKSLDPDKTAKKAFRMTEEGLKLSNKLEQKRIARECADWIREKVDVRTVVREGFLHGKLYHVVNSGTENAVLGSSNFTVRGLGLGAAGNNIELNLEVDSSRDRADLKCWFNELWNDTALVRDVKAEVIAYLEKIYENHSPEFIYYLTLFHIFREYLDGEKNVDETLRQTTLLETKVWSRLFAFQKDGVKGAINRILTHNGCILADSVGLGKTYEALAVIKYFELRNERVLVLCPKKLMRNWTVFRSPERLNPFDEDRFRYDVFAHTDLSRATGIVNGVQLANVNWGNYDLVVIDESHNFRNNAFGTPKQDGTPRRTRYERLIEDIISSGVRTKVLLLSATPVNNQLADLRNQISFIAGGDVARAGESDAAFAEKLGIQSVKETTRLAQQRFTQWAKEPAAKRNTRDLIASLGSDFFKLLDGLSIARSRRQIIRHYQKEMERLGGFPERGNKGRPDSIFPDIDTEKKFLSFEQLDQEISTLKLSLYHPTTYLRTDLSESIRAGYEAKIGNFNQEGRERILIAMMKVNFLKRLESSVDSFRLTLQRTIEKIDRLEARIAAFEEHRNESEIDYESLAPSDFDDPEDGEEEFLIGGKHRIHLAHLRIEEWLKAVRHDRVQLQYLLEKTEPIGPSRDAKLLALRGRIAAKVQKPTITRDGRQNRKVLIFTAFADTAIYLYNNLHQWAREELGVHIALVQGTGDNKTTLGKTDFEHILTNFSPIAKQRSEQPNFPQTEEIDILIATDCISEGQNLQDCDLLINYDIHWNPVRIIQRFGRIDRIGSRNAEVNLINFWPTKDLDRYLNVKHRVEARMALVDLTASGEDNLLEPEQIEDLIATDMRYRDRQLARLKDEILDLEDLTDDTVSLTDFSLDDFRLDLLRFLEANRTLLEEAELGLYAVVPPVAEKLACKPGVIFCLRQLNGTAPREKSVVVNPLQPHFLVYIHDDGSVRFTFAQPKQSLELLQALCAGQSSANQTLCDLFDSETKDGADMSHHSTLLQKAVHSIADTFRKRTAAALQSGRGSLIAPKSEQPQNDDDFELITWLVIKEAKFHNSPNDRKTT